MIRSLIDKGSVALTLIIKVITISLGTNGSIARGVGGVAIDLPEGYDRGQRPFHGVKQLNVTAQIEILNVGPVNDKHMHFMAEVFLRQWWMDVRLKNRSDNQIVFSDEPRSMIWIPDTYFPTSITVHGHDLTVPNIRVYIKPDGNVYVSRRLTLELNCFLSLVNYPLDIQKCTMPVESFSFPKEDLSYLWASPPVVLSRSLDTFSIEGYKVADISAKNVDLLYSSIEEVYSSLRVEFIFTRNFLHFMLHLYLPSLILVTLTFASFWIPHTAYPARVTLTVTNFLATLLFVQTVTSAVNITDHMNAMELFLSFNLAFIFMTMLEYIIVLNTENREFQIPISIKIRKKIGKRVEPPNLAYTQQPTAASKIPEVTTTCHLQNNKSKHTEIKAGKQSGVHITHFIDQISKALFPTTYFVTLLIYFAYFSYKRNDNYQRLS